MDKRQPKFFCEYCGSEVRQNDKLCHHCGRFFASVKCPSCGFTGDSPMFRDGCPACGYAVTGNGPSLPPKSAPKKKDAGTDPLPWWIYLAAILMLAGFVALVLIRK